MPSWPCGREYVRRPVFISNVQEWIRRTGRPANYTSATFYAGAAFSRIYVPYRFTAKRLWVANGDTPVGNCGMALCTVGDDGLPGEMIATSALDVAGDSDTAQFFSITPTRISPGWYFISYANSNAASEVLQLFAPTATDAIEANIGGSYLGSAPPIASGVDPVTAAIGGTLTCIPIMGVVGTAA